MHCFRPSHQYRNTTDALLQSDAEKTTEQDIPVTSSLCTAGCADNNTTQQVTADSAIQSMKLKGPTKVIAYIYSVILVILGVPGNIVAFVVLLRENCKKMPGSIFLLSMTFSDIMVIFFTQILGTWVLNTFGIILSNKNNILCKSLPPCVTFFSDISKISLLAFSLERILCICFPLKAKGLVSQKRRIIFLITLVTVQLLFLTNDIITFQIVVKNNEIKCEPLGWSFLMKVRYGLAMVFSLVPGIAMAIFNVAIIAVLLRQRIQLGGIKSTGSNDNVGVSVSFALEKIILCK